MSLYSDSSIRLVRDAQRASALSTFVPYREDLIKDILTESRHLRILLSELYTKLSSNSIIESKTALEISCVMHGTALRHNKRILLAYFYHRFQKLHDIFWSLGIGSSSLSLPESITKNLSPSEFVLKKEYQSLIQNYRSTLGDLDLGGEDIPPKDVYIEVRVVKECGTLLTEDGTVVLSKGSMHHLKRSLVEKLIRTGHLFQIG